jgi:hypothetical protein
MYSKTPRLAAVNARRSDGSNPACGGLHARARDRQRPAAARDAFMTGCAKVERRAVELRFDRFMDEESSR